MKNLMRFAMVLALAGSALLYSGCTKDYQKDIDDLNTGVTTLQGTVQKLQEQVSALEALKSQVASLQGDVAPLQAAINKNTEAIAKLQDAGYVTKDELDAELNSIREETLDALADVAIVVGGNTEAIAELRKAYEAADAFTEALNLGKIASVALVRDYGTNAPTNYVALNAWELVDNATSPNTLYKTTTLLNLTYQVSPASLAGSLNETNTSLSVYSPVEREYVSVPVTITDADAETGLVSLYVDLFSESLADYFDEDPDDDSGKYYTPFGLVIDDESKKGIKNEIRSQYDFACVDETATPVALKYFAKIENIEVPYDKFASSERKFYDNVNFELTYTYNGDPYSMSLEEAASIFEVDVEDITPTLAKKIKTTHYRGTPATADAAATYIKTDESAWTAKMKATKLADALTALNDKAYVEATTTASILKDGITTRVWGGETTDASKQTYSIVNAEGDKDIIFTKAGEVKWNGSSTVTAQTILNFSTNKKLADPTTLYLFRTYKDGNAAKFNVVLVKYDDENVDVEILDTEPTSNAKYDAAQTAATAGLTSPSFAAIPFDTKATTLEFTGTYTDQLTDFNASLTLKLGAKPADKKNLDLGPFKVDGSYTKNTTVELINILETFIGTDTELWKNVPNNTGLAGNLKAVLAAELGASQKAATSVIVETNGTSVARDATTDPALSAYEFTFNVPDTEPDKGKDKSTLTLPKPTEAGQTYIVSFEFTPFGVTYAGKLRVEVGNAANFALEAVPGYIKDGEILVTYESTDDGRDMDGSTYYNKPIALEQINFANYFRLNKVLKNENANDLDLRVVITLEGDKYTATDGTKLPYLNDSNWTVNGTTTNKLILNVSENGTVYQQALESASTSILDWEDYTGTTIKATATLYKNYGDGSNPTKINEIKFDINRELPFKTFGVKNIDKAVNFGYGVKINLADALDLTSILYQSKDVAVTEEGQPHAAAVPADPSTGQAAVAEKPFRFSFASHLLTPDCLGVINDKGEFVKFEDVTELTVKRDGSTTTLHANTDFEFIKTVGSDDAFVLELKPNNAVTTMTMDLTLGLKVADTIDYSSAAAGAATPQYATWSKPVTITLTRE